MQQQLGLMPVRTATERYYSILGVQLGRKKAVTQRGKRRKKNTP
jgi:hypothetical protein